MPKPSPCFLDECEPLGFVYGEKRWRNRGGTRLYTWDALHSEIEVFNARGRHVGVCDAVTGVTIKPPVKGRKIDV